jgi:hypothetical protein
VTRRRKAGFLLGTLALGASGWWALGAREPELPALLADRSPEAVGAFPELVGFPPFGTRWETYIVHLPYPEAVAAIEAEGKWRGAQARGPVPTHDFTAAGSSAAETVRVVPGRFLRVAATQPCQSWQMATSRGFSSILVARRQPSAWSKAFQGWMDRLRGRSPETTAREPVAIVYSRDPDLEHRP